MGFTNRSRIQQSIISRRRTQYSFKETISEINRTTSGDVGDNKTSKETSRERNLGQHNEASLDKTKRW